MSCEHKDLNSIPGILEKKLSVVPSGCNPTAGELESDGLMGLYGQPAFFSWQFQTSERLFKKKKCGEGDFADEW